MPTKSSRGIELAARAQMPALGCQLSMNSKTTRPLPKRSVHFAEPLVQVVVYSLEEDVTRPEADESIPIPQEASENSTISDGPSGTGQASSKFSSTTSIIGSKDDMDDLEMVELSHGLQIQACYVNKLYLYQLEGITWILDLYFQKQGGILADEKGYVPRIIQYRSHKPVYCFQSSVLTSCLSLFVGWERQFKQLSPSPLSCLTMLSKIQ